MNTFDLDVEFNRVDIWSPMLLTALFQDQEDTNALVAPDDSYWLEEEADGTSLTHALTNLFKVSIYGELIARSLHLNSVCPKTGLEMLSSQIDLNSFLRILTLFKIDDGTLLNKITEWKVSGHQVIAFNWYENPPEQSFEEYEDSNPHKGAENNEPECLEIIPYETVCKLDVSGFSYTLNQVYDWAVGVLKEITEQLGHKDLVAKVRPMRVNGDETINLSIWKKDKSDRFDINFQMGDIHDFDLNDPCVPDSIEAMHMIGIVCKSLNLKIEITGSNNELNPYCTPTEWAQDQTNATLEIATKGVQG